MREREVHAAQSQVRAAWDLGLISGELERSCASLAPGAWPPPTLKPSQRQSQPPTRIRHFFIHLQTAQSWGGRTGCAPAWGLFTLQWQACGGDQLPLWHLADAFLRRGPRPGRRWPCVSAAERTGLWLGQEPCPMGHPSEKLQFAEGTALPWRSRLSRSVARALPPFAYLFPLPRPAPCCAGHVSAGRCRETASVGLGCGSK